MALFPAIRGYMIAKRFEKAQKTASGLIVLPEEWTEGDREGTTEYRLCRILEVASDIQDVKKDDIVLIHELDKVPPGKEYLMPDDKSLEVIPRERVMGIGTCAADLKPVDNVIFVELDLPKEQVTSGGIILPEYCEPLEQQGIVTAVGPKCQDVKVGDRVLMIRGYGLRYNFSGKKCVAIKEDENDGLLGILEPMEPFNSQIFEKGGLVGIQGLANE